MSLTSLRVLSGSSGARGAPIDVEELRQALVGTISGEVRFDRLSRALYSTDASVYQIVPLGVVLPKTEADIIAAIKTCARFGVPLTSRGGGTSQAGQCIGAGIVLDCSKYFNTILQINPAERWARAQPGCVLDDVNAAAKAHGLQFAPDISTSNRATIGGMVANNSSGTHSVIYGKTIDHVLALKAALSDGSVVDLHALTPAEFDAKSRQQDLQGACYRKLHELAALHAEEIDRRYPKILRRVGGYNLDSFVPGRSADHSLNLSHLLVGSEGTLAVTLEAKLNLVELPSAKALAVVHFDDLLQALQATPLILAHQPAAVEVIDKFILDSTRMNAEAARLRGFLRGDPAAILIVEFYGEQQQELSPRLERLEVDLRQRGFGYHIHQATDAAEQARIWKLRKMALGLSMAEKGDAKAISFVEDTAVAPEHLRDYIAEFLSVIARHGTKAGVYAHASVGCLHVRPVINLKTEGGVSQFEAIAEEVADLVLKYGGALSGEHGDGLVRSPFQEKMFGPVLTNAFRDLKRTFDPLNVLNPGKIVDAPPLTSNLRYGPGYATPEVPTTFDFSSDGGMVRSAELCAGVGDCRKKREGTMCPSYQATCDEKDSTRGRANALRLAITGQLGLQGLTDPALFEALDLCLECKACKSECPTNVDMARLKAEFLHQYYQAHGLPWRNWIFGHVAGWSRWSFPFGPVVNQLAASGVVRWFNDKAFGIDARRPLPRLAEQSFLAQASSIPAPASNGRRSVLVFPDTFTLYYEPTVGMAVLRLLQKLGQPFVLALPHGTRRDSSQSEIRPCGLRCCGRPLISNGLLAKAVDYAQHNVERLYPWVAATGNPIIACEPSCILTIKDDYPALLQGEWRRKAEVVAEACQTVEQFLEGNLAEQFSAALGASQLGPKKILVQGHCHQRSLTGMDATLRLLRRIPGADVIDLEAGCCGMAGSFGYEKEHYEISRQVGEQRLFPALRKADSQAAVAAPGFSCRSQIRHFTGRTALHPAQLCAGLLTPHADRPSCARVS
jgi:FAD/FMN-containing dehydrogenase/Fe-S oxidoreductase